MKMKLDFLNLVNTSLDIIASSRSQKAKDYGVSIEWGFQLFVSYLKEISNRAIEINDPIILECLHNTGIIICEEDEIKDITERAKKIREENKK